MQSQLIVVEGLPGSNAGRAGSHFSKNWLSTFEVVERAGHLYLAGFPFFWRSVDAPLDAKRWKAWVDR